MFIEEKYNREEIIYPLDFEEVMEELHSNEFPVDEYSGATIDLLDLETGLQFTVLLSWWYQLNEDTNYQHNYIIIN